MSTPFVITDPPICKVCRILLADPDDLERGMSEAALWRLGFETQGVGEAAAAVWLASMHRYDVLVVKQSTPRLDACSVIRRLRGMGCMIPVVLICGAAEHRHLPADTAQQAVCVLADNSPAEVLTRSIKSVLTNSQPLSARS